MKDPAWQGDWPINAGYLYSSGAVHAAYDVGMPIGTPLYAPFDAIVKEIGDGVDNNSPGYNPGSGAPSNYRLLWSQDRPERTVYFQHMNKGVPDGIKVGARIKRGTKIGTSGNTGNSTGPHLHLASSDLWTLDQYAYDDGCTQSKYGPNLIYPPTDAWKDEEDMPSAEEIAKAVWNFDIDVSTTNKPDLKPAKVVLKQARNQADEASDETSQALNKLETLLERTEKATLQNTIWDEVGTTSDAPEPVKVRKMLRDVWQRLSPPSA